MTKAETELAGIADLACLYATACEINDRHTQKKIVEENCVNFTALQMAFFCNQTLSYLHTDKHGAVMCLTVLTNRIVSAMGGK